MNLITENCSGGMVYDRILQQTYFVEQESAVLVRHVLESLSLLHRQGISHGQLTPESFRFHSEQRHAPLKLVDFGLELKVYLWDSLSLATAGIYDAGHSEACLQLLEPSKIVFCAPELAHLQQQEQPQTHSNMTDSAYPEASADWSEKLDIDLLAEAIDAHLDQAEELNELCANGSLEAADVWSIGAIAFLLLCGYPPFFAPCKSDILARISKADFSFDPPFWSKISEEAKDFVQLCFRWSPSSRLTITEALQHPWIQSLADTSPTGPMLSSFAQNLRRFYRTSLIEVFAANSLATKLNVSGIQDLYARCCEADLGQGGFLTATDLRQILARLGHTEIAEAIGMCFSRTMRHPGESYLDYRTLLESVRARRKRLLEEELWKHFHAFASASTGDGAGIEISGQLPLSRLHGFLKEPEVRQLLERDGLGEETTAALADGAAHVAACFRPNSGCGEEAAGPAVPAAGALSGALSEVFFVDIAAEVLRHLPPVTTGSRSC